jgi:hypothetical protein
MDKQTVKDIQRSIMMKLNKVDYSVDMTNGYEDTERVYKQLRDKLSDIVDSITWLMTYEHGGSKMKSFYSKVKMITTTSKLDYFNNHDIYEANGFVGSELSKVELPSGLNDMSKKYSKAYLNISKYKVEMNNKLRLEIVKISTLQDKACAIDKKRKKVVNARYDLEMMKRSKSPRTSESITKEDELEHVFREISKTTLEEMERFVGYDGVSGILQKVAEAHLEFSEKSEIGRAHV